MPTNGKGTLTDYLYAKAAANRVPLGGSFELTPVCNFRCKMCYIRHTPESLRLSGKRLHTADEWLRLGRECRDAGMLYLLLTGGEPFLFPEFRRLYEGLHQMGLVLSINTNGSMITAETVEWLKKWAPSRVNITLYGFSPETYERVTGNPAGFEKTIAAIRMLREAGIQVVVNVSLIPENADDLEKIAAFGREMGLNTRITSYMFPPARREAEEGDSRFTPAEAAALHIRKLRCQYDREHYLAHLQRDVLSVDRFDGAAAPAPDWGSSTEDYMRCRAGRSSFWVNWEGEMTACGMMDFPPVKCRPFEQPFAECYAALTEETRKTPVLAGCVGCAYREICHPCAAMAMTETGDPNGRPTYLCEMAREIYKRSKEALREEGIHEKTE